jgi:hypothetical protein
MNLFKGLLYLIENDQPASPVLIEAPHYGAATAANEFAGELGNRAASQRRFGARVEGVGEAPRRAAGGSR